MPTRRESAGGNLLRRYLDYRDRRVLNMHHYAGSPSLIIRRRYDLTIRPGNPRTVIDLTSFPEREEIKVNRKSVSRTR